MKLAVGGISVGLFAWLLVCVLQGKVSEGTVHPNAYIDIIGRAETGYFLKLTQDGQVQAIMPLAATMIRIDGQEAICHFGDKAWTVDRGAQMMTLLDKFLTQKA